MARAQARVVVVLAAVAPLTLAPPSTAQPRQSSAATTAEAGGGHAVPDGEERQGARARLRTAFEAGSAVAGYELAVVLVEQVDLLGARGTLRRVVQLTSPAAEGLAAQRAAARLLGEVEARLPRLQLELGSLAAKLSQLAIDGVELPPQQWAELQPLNPGRHIAVAQLKDGTALETTFSIAEATLARLSLELPAPPPPARPVATLPTAQPERADAGQALRQPPAAPADGQGRQRHDCPSGDLDGGECLTQSRDYTWQIASLDGLMTASLALGLSTRLTIPAVFGAVGYPWSSPIVHWSHGHLGRGFASLGLHTVPLLGLATFISVHARENEELPGPASMVAMSLLAGGLGFGLDYLILGHTDETRTPAASDTARLTPLLTVVPSRGGAAASLQLAF